MSDISVRGFVQKPAVKNGSKGDFSVFTLSEGQKQKDGSYLNVFFNVTAFNEATPPEDGSRVQVSGYLKMRKYTKDGQERQSLDIVASKIEVISPPKEKAEPAGDAVTAGEDPFDL